MKRKRHLFASLFFLLLFTSFATAQSTDTITLLVDTSTPSNSYFSGQQPGDNPETFLTTVDVGDLIIWEGRAINSSEEIYITRIQRKRGRNIFNQNQITNIPGRSGRGNNRARAEERTVRAVVRKSTVDDNGNNDDYHYRITYRIGTSNPPNTHTIDPIIRTNY